MEVNDMSTTLTMDEPKVRYRGVKAMPFIIGNETFEKLGAIGTLANLLVYLTKVFNMKSITATTLVNVFHGTTNLATLIGAFLSDTYFGRYKTLAFASIASFLGLLVIALTAIIKDLHPPQCSSEPNTSCIGATSCQIAFLLTGFGFMVVGAGGIRPCNLAFGADQFDPNTESGKRGIDSFFNWYFFTFSVAVMVSLTVVVYVQSNVSWGIGLAIPTVFMLTSVVLFFMGTYMYVKVKPQGSPFTRLIQVIVAAIKKRRLVAPERPWDSLFNYIPPNSVNSKLPYTDQFRFLDKAAILTRADRVNENETAANPWRLCTMQQVEEMKCILRVIPIWASGILYSVSMVQQHTYLVLQALQSDRYLAKTNFQIPAASYPVFNMVVLTTFLPIYDCALVPIFRRLTRKEGGITVLQRMGVGMALSVATSSVAAVIERRRRIGSTTRISSMSAMWLTPQLALAGLAEAFMAVGQIEFYYKQFPENMRSLAGAFPALGMAVSSYLSGFLVTVVHGTTRGKRGKDWLAEDLNEGRLEYFYYLVAGLGAINLVYFLLCSKWYRYKGT